MNINDIKKELLVGLGRWECLYTDPDAECPRIIEALDTFYSVFGRDDVMVLSVPGRSEIIGNHTDHNSGKVMAGAITRDIVAVAARNDSDYIRFRSEGYPADQIPLSAITDPDAFKRFTSRALVAGVAGGFVKAGYKVSGFDIYMTTKVQKGSGLSSSAAFEVMVGNALNHLFNGGEIDNKEIAKIARYSENVYFGKPCGLMDQMACAVGGFVYIDFADSASPGVTPVSFSLSDAGYALCITNTGGSHANLNDDYASVPEEMKAVARAIGREVLLGATEEELIASVDKIRKAASDRALLRAIHFVRECERVERAKAALTRGDTEAFLKQIKESGESSFCYLQNVFTCKAPGEQGMSLALALSDGYLRDKGGAWRVHGGGFAGTVQAFVPKSSLEGYKALLNSVFGEGAVDVLSIRPYGAIRLY
ncbi:MAG: galactokinase [Clostridia bacterium]|nr:galactokinase [Clostridia bacterium]